MPPRQTSARRPTPTLGTRAPTSPGADARRTEPLDSAPATPPTSASDPAARAWDGRRTHVVDRAADYVALHAQGLTVAQIARRRRRSKGYVSILLRLGQVLATLPAGEVAAYRSPRITWALAQRVVRRDTPAVEVRAQLRYALGGFSTHNLDRRRRGLRGPRGGAPSTMPAPADPPTPGAGGSRAAPPVGAPDTGMLAGWGFDEALFDADPVGFARAHLQRLAAVHHALAARAARAVRHGAAERLAVGQSLRGLARLPVPRPSHGAPWPSPEGSVALRGGELAAAPPDQRAVLAAFAVFEAGLRAAVQGALEALESARPDGAAPRGTNAVPTPASPTPRTPHRPHTPARRPVSVSADELAEDLADEPTGSGADALGRGRRA